MSSTKGSITSEALEANLSLTRAEVVIPAEDRILLEAVERYCRVHEVVRTTLEEYHHPFRNVSDVIEGLRTLCAGMLHYYEVSEPAADCAGRLQALFEGLYLPDLDEDSAERLVETHLTLLCNLGASGDPGRFRDVLELGVSSLVREVDLHELAFILHAGDLRRLAPSLAWDEALARAAASVYARLVRGVLERWRRFLCEPSRRERVGLDGEMALPAVDDLAGRLDELDTALDTASDPVQTLSLETPDELVAGLVRELDSQEGSTASLGTLHLLVELLPLPHRVQQCPYLVGSSLALAIGGEGWGSGGAASAAPPAPLGGGKANGSEERGGGCLVALARGGGRGPGTMSPWCGPGRRAPFGMVDDATPALASPVGRGEGRSLLAFPAPDQAFCAHPAM